MPLFGSISRKLILIGLVFFIFITGFIYQGFRLTHHIADDATRINMAGKMRYRSFEIAWLVHAVYHPVARPEPFLMEELEREIEMFDKTYHDLRYGNKDLDLRPLEYEDIINLIDTMHDKWQRSIRPKVIALMRGTEEKERLIAEIDSEVHDFVYSYVDPVVSALEGDYKEELREANYTWLILIIAFLITLSLLIIYIKKVVLSPITKVMDTVSEIEKGDFNVRLDVKGEDEIGRLSKAINSMAGAIDKLFNEQVRIGRELKSHVDDFRALADSANVISAVPLEEDIYETICNVIIRNFDIKMVWIGIPEEEGKRVRPVVQSGFEEGYLSAINITWDDSSTGMGPTGMAIKTRSPQVMNHIDTDPRYEPWRQEALKRGYRSSMALPIIGSEADVIGVLNLYSGEPEYFTERRVRIFNLLSNYVSTAIENRSLIEELDKKVKERTEKLESAMLQAEAANRAKSDFLANMSHELRTPLNAIIGFSDILVEGMVGRLTDEQKDLVHDILTSAHHLLSLINDILDLSKIESGRMELELSEFNLEDVINSSFILFREKAMKHGIKTSCDFEKGIENIIADKRKIKQVIVNLLSNAFKFTPDGGSIKVVVRKISAGETGAIDLVRVSVEDTGIGISPDDQKKLFKPFEQLHSSLARRHQGTGLGLSICKRIIDLSKGRIWVESELGKGSKFIFTIPIRAWRYPEKKVFSMKTFLRHIDRCISFHRRQNLQFGIIRFDITNEDIDHLLIIEALLSQMRHHELLANGGVDKRYYIVLLACGRQEVMNAIERFIEVLIQIGYNADFRMVVYPDDGQDKERLLKILNR